MTAVHDEPGGLSNDRLAAGGAAEPPLLLRHPARLRLAAARRRRRRPSASSSIIERVRRTVHVPTITSWSVAAARRRHPGTMIACGEAGAVTKRAQETAEGEGGRTIRECLLIAGTRVIRRASWSALSVAPPPRILRPAASTGRARSRAARASSRSGRGSDRIRTNVRGAVTGPRRRSPSTRPPRSSRRPRTTPSVDRARERVRTQRRVSHRSRAIRRRTRTGRPHTTPARRSVPPRCNRAHGAPGARSRSDRRRGPGRYRRR